MSLDQADAGPGDGVDLAAVGRNRLDTWSIARTMDQLSGLLGDAAMSTEIGSYDAKTKLPEILRRVEQGESFTITNRGKPIADLIPSRAAEKHRAETAIKNLREAAGKYVVSDEELANMKSEGRE